MASAQHKIVQWVVYKDAGIEGLKLETHDALLQATLGKHDCLVRLEAVSLNYRDVAIPTGIYQRYTRPQYIPCSDAAGVVLDVGSSVTQFKPGDKVCPTFFQDFETGYLTPAGQESSLGGKTDGVLRSETVFQEKGLTKIPSTLSVQEASTLPCAAVTAWNSLFGLEGRKVKSGDYVLTEGTGGVSIFAIQFALAVDANVIATTSSASKGNRLKAMGVQHVINYKKDENWGETAKKLTTHGLGVNHVVEVGGSGTLNQALKAIRMEGVISLIGFLSGNSAKSETSLWDAITSLCIVRGVNVGSKAQFQEMNKFIEEHNIKPVVDPETFPFEKAREALLYLQAQKQWGKVVIDGYKH